MEPSGTSGAVSAAGTLAAAAGAFLIACFAAPQGITTVGIVAVAGFGGALFDSFLGATVQAQWHDPVSPDHWTERPVRGEKPHRGFAYLGNDAVNALASLFAILLAASLLKA